MPNNDIDSGEVASLIDSTGSAGQIGEEESRIRGLNANNHQKEPSSPSSSPTRIGNSRTLDSYLEDAYREHSSTLWSCCRHQWKYWVIMLSLGIANSSDCSEILCISYLLSNATFLDTILLNSDWRGGMLAAAVFAGMLMGGLIMGTLGDWLGRRKCLLFGLVLNMSAGLLSACAPNVFILTALRMVAGVGIGASVPPLFTLVAELAAPSQRGFCVTLCASFWMVGSIFVALVAILFLKNDNDETDTADDSFQLTVALRLARWRVFAFACAIPSAAGSALVHWLVPESPRFLALRGRFDEASRAANSLGRSMRYNGPPLEPWEMAETFGGVARSTANYHPSHSFDEEDSYDSWCMISLRWIRLALADFWFSANKLYTVDLRRKTWPLQMVWFSLSFGSYGLMTWINTLFFAVHLEDVYFNALLFALANLPGNLMTAYLMDRTGRSKLLVGSILSASLSLLAFAAFASTSNETSESAPPHTYGIVMSACSFQCFTIAAWNTIDVMTSELFPTTVRSTGMGICAASGRIGAMIAQFVNGALVGHPVRLLVVASITLAMGATTPFLLPRHGDMTGLSLEEEYSRSSSHVSPGENDNCEGQELEDLSARADDAMPTIQESSPGSMKPKIMGLSRRLHPPPDEQGPYQKMPIHNNEAQGGLNET